ncbi:hypothetical protein ACLOJK_010066 [Asimina triloba]
MVNAKAHPIPSNEKILNLDSPEVIREVIKVDIAFFAINEQSQKLLLHLICRDTRRRRRGRNWRHPFTYRLSRGQTKPNTDTDSHRKA